MTAQLQATLEGGAILHLEARISHVRTGGLRHAFRYGADYLLFSPEKATHSQGLLRRNARGIFSLWDCDYGAKGKGASWVWEAFADAGLPPANTRTLALLTQPRFCGFVFNPVSFWLLFEEGALKAVLAEVTNTWRERHSYLCQAQDFGPLTASTKLTLSKVFHVSPFQDVGGEYSFRFGFSNERADVLICHKGPKAGLVARMQGRLVPLKQKTLFGAILRRPGGALRVLALIYLQAIKLKLRGAAWRLRPALPSKDITK